jgi:hypothetical protein|tara:strand:- start:10 stop:465 length:456 start_codon:yes stop_codon:yes gene_type:complete
MTEIKKKYVAYDPETFEFRGFYTEGRKDLPSSIAEVDPVSFIEDMGQHTHYSPERGFYTVVVELTEEELRRDFKEAREIALNELTVEVAGLVYDADETSRSRMADTIVALEPEEENLWVLADNSVVMLSRESLVSVLRAIGKAQNNLWLQN